MKKQDFNSLKLNKKSISNLSQLKVTGKGVHTQGCYSKQVCPTKPIDTTITFQPIPNPDPDTEPATLSELGLC